MQMQMMCGEVTRWEGLHPDYHDAPGAVVTGQHPGKCELPRDMSLDQVVSWLIRICNLKLFFFTEKP